MAIKKGRSSKQSGGTFLGVVLGLIVGLAIAVVVALYITRSPTPFVSRGTPAPVAGSDANAGVYDPNRPLAGTTPGQALPSAAQPAPPNTAPGQPANPSAGLLSEPQIVEVPPSTAPLQPPAAPSAPHQPSEPGMTPAEGGLASRQRPNAAVPASSAPAPAARPPAAGDTNTSYQLQAGAFKTQGDADQQRARLALLGYSATVSKRDSGAAVYYRVRVGPYAKFEDMSSARAQLTAAGIETAVIRIEKR